MSKKVLVFRPKVAPVVEAKYVFNPEAFTQIPNILFDAMPLLTAEQFKVGGCVFRCKDYRISTIATYTGMPKETVASAMDALRDRGLLI
jgi:hypothetical protein